MKSLLKMNPEERLNVDQALEHPYFEDIRKMYEKKNSSQENLTKREHTNNESDTIDQNNNT